VISRYLASLAHKHDNIYAMAFPQLKLVASHLGGGICEMIGCMDCMDYAYNLQEEAYFLGPYEPTLIKHQPSHYLKMRCIESTCYWAPGARCALDSDGADHFIFGTDAPPLKRLKKAASTSSNPSSSAPPTKPRYSRKTHSAC
jgi:predicted TIM-barrel fold metal-dependent hydrolase